METTNTSESRAQRWRRILAHELFEYLCNFVFLAFFLLAFGWYRQLILDEYHIETTGCWAPLIEAAILAKIIMIGEAMSVGQRLRSWPLIIPTIYRTFVFSLLVVVFSLAEHVVGALIHGKTVASGFAEVAAKDPHELLAWYVLIIAVFLPFFTIKEIEQVFGRDKVRELFFGLRSHLPSAK